MSVTRKLREMIEGTVEKVVEEDGSRLVVVSVVVSPLVRAGGWETPFVRGLGGSGADVVEGGGICSQRTWVGWVIFGMNMRFVWAS